MKRAEQQLPSPAPSEVLEIRTFKLRPESSAAFDHLANVVARPLQEAVGIEVVAAFPSLEDGEHYMVVRRFASERSRQQLEERFYSSDAWIHGPRSSVLELIEAYHSIVLPITSPDARALSDALAEPRSDRDDA